MEKIGESLLEKKQKDLRKDLKEREEMIAENILNNILTKYEQQNEELMVACKRYMKGRIMKRYPDAPNEDTEGMFEMQEAKRDIKSCVGRECAEKIVEIIENYDW